MTTFCRGAYNLNSWCIKRTLDTPFACLTLFSSKFSLTLSSFVWGTILKMDNKYAEGTDELP